MKEILTGYIVGPERLVADSADAPMGIPGVTFEESRDYHKIKMFHVRLNQLKIARVGAVSADLQQEIEQAAIEVAIQVIDDGVYTEEEVTDYLDRAAGLSD